MTRHLPLRRRCSTLLLGLAALFVAAPAAEAQFGNRGFREVAQPDVDRTQIQIIGEMVGFSEEQLELAFELHQGYLAEMTDLEERVREIVDGVRNEFRETRDPSIWQEMMSAMVPLSEEKDGYTRAFMEDLELILNADQFEQWPEVERFHRRYTSFSDDGMLSGETVDVALAVRDMDLPEVDMQAVEPILMQYSMELDRALKARNAAYEEGMSQGMARWRQGDMEAIQKLWEDAKREAERVRDINRRYANQIEQTLDPAFAGEWAREFKEQSFPRVYRRTYTGRALDTAMRFEDLTSEQTEQLEAIFSEYQRRVDSMNDDIAKLIEDSEMTRDVMSMMGRGRRGGEQDEVRNARGEKSDYEESVLARLNGVLTTAQQIRLPEREDNRDWRERLPNRGNNANRGGGRPREL
ncbi:MAG: hypothetical protein AAGH64_05215 [Planctomycetota bacterium]